MSIERVRPYLESMGYGERIREFEASSATVALAAEALGVEGARIAKTLSFHHEGGCLLIVAAGDARIDNGKFKATFGHKAKMLSPEDAERLVGHAVGGVCPFAVKDTASVYLDRSLQRFEIVYPAAGNSHSGVELSPDELFIVGQAIDWVDVCKDWE